MIPTWSRRRIAPKLRTELTREPNWMRPWYLPGNIQMTLLNPELECVHRSRAEMIEPPVREVLAHCPRRTAIDLVCSEG